MRNLILIMAMLAALSCQAVSTTPKLDIKDETVTVENDVRAMSDALASGDSDTLLRYTYPAIVEKLGGPATFGKVYKGISSAQVRAGIKRVSLTFPTPPEFIEGKDGRWFVLVTSRTELSSGGGHGALTGFHLGVKEPDANDWKYIPGQLISPDLLPSLVPDFPADHPLPPKRSMEKLG